MSRPPFGLSMGAMLYHRCLESFPPSIAHLAPMSHDPREGQQEMHASRFGCSCLQEPKSHVALMQLRIRKRPIRIRRPPKFPTGSLSIPGDSHASASDPQLGSGEPALRLLVSEIVTVGPVLHVSSTTFSFLRRIVDDFNITIYEIEKNLLCFIQYRAMKVQQCATIL